MLERSGVARSLLALVSGRPTRDTLASALDETMLTVAMIFTVFAGATIFAFVFRTLGGEHAIVAFIEGTFAPIIAGLDFSVGMILFVGLQFSAMVFALLFPALFLWLLGCKTRRFL